jgi:ferredoxin-NADP reductase
MRMTTAEASSGFTIKLLGGWEVAERTMAFRFEKPSGWIFKAGQFVDMTLINPPETDAEGDIRSFSIASAPFEERLMIATRLRDTAFKRTLSTMPRGTEVRIEGPFGNLTLHNTPARPAVFVTGGIGITPIRSILWNAAREKLPHRIFLFYSNRRPEDAPFLEELDALQRENPHYRLVATMTKVEESRHPWHGETGYITHEMLSKYLTDAASAIYYITGPAAMVTGLRDVLNSAGVNDDDIRTEEFTGY